MARFQAARSRLILRVARERVVSSRFTLLPLRARTRLPSAILTASASCLIVRFFFASKASRLVSAHPIPPHGMVGDVIVDSRFMRDWAVRFLRSVSMESVSPHPTRVLLSIVVNAWSVSRSSPRTLLASESPFRMVSSETLPVPLIFARYHVSIAS